MYSEMETYLKSIKKTCTELTEKDILHFSDGLTITKLDKNDIYIKNQKKTESLNFHNPTKRQAA